MPILANVLVSARDDRVSITGTDNVLLSSRRSVVLEGSTPRK